MQQQSTDETSVADRADEAGTGVNGARIAIRELQATINEATEYTEGEVLDERHIKLHVAALEEDISLLASFSIQDEPTQKICTELIFKARRLKRKLERETINLQSTYTSDIPMLQLIQPDHDKTAGKLEPLKIPTFDGDKANFKTFSSFFSENILNNKKITNTGKWLRLKAVLKGEPADLISELPDGAVTIAWELLNETYGGDDQAIVGLYHKLQNLPMAQNTTDSLRMTFAKLQGILLSLEELEPGVNENKYIRWSFINKFPPEVLYQVQQQKNSPLELIRTKMKELILARESVDKQHQSYVQPKPTEPTPLFTTEQLQSLGVRAARPTPPLKKSWQPPTARQIKCLFCNTPHWSDECPTYTTVESRKNRIPDKCHKCLRQVHTPTPCIRERRCVHCESTDHNRALCPTKFGKENSKNLAIIPEQGQYKKGYFLTFMTKVMSKYQAQPINARVVIDTAGGSTLATKSILQSLNVPLSNHGSTKYIGLGGAQLLEGIEVDTPIILLTHAGEPVEIQVAAVTSIATDVPAANVSEFRTQHPQYADIQIPETGQGKPVDLLLGGDVLVDFLDLEKSITVDKEIQLMATKFGWIIMGRKNTQAQEKTILMHMQTNPIKQLSDMDLIGFTDIHSTQVEEEQKAITKFYESVKYVDNRYSISWPWRYYPPNLGTNFGLALGRLRTLHKRLKNQPKLLQDYNTIIHEQLKSGIIELAPQKSTSEQIIHYLPHHPVLQPDKSTAVRLVYDASAITGKYSKSLNDNILKGTSWLNDLAETLIRFRRYAKAATADIAKAFHQIAINDADRDAVRFLWVKDTDKEVTESNLLTLRFTRVAFGIVASPFILSATIKHHANQQKHNPLTENLVADLYADNLVTSLPSHTDMIKYYHHAKYFFRSMSMNLTKWATNDGELKENIGEDDQQIEETQSVLGLKWHIPTDTLAIKQPTMPPETAITRRIVAREMAKYFDPLGWAVPILLLPKIFFRKLWEETTNWDETLSQTQTEEWRNIHKKMEDIKHIRVQRKMFQHTNPTPKELHAFVDASEQAYAIVVYIKTENGENTEISLIAAKSRLTPKNKLTVPKLELIAILLGCRFVDFVKKALKWEDITQTYIWSDSRCALTWMEQKKILPAVIERYINQAKQYNINQFRYIPSEQNYADIATRGTEYQTLQLMKWWTGPEWLKSKENWPPLQLADLPETYHNLLIFEHQLTEKQVIIEETQIEGVATLNVSKYSTLVDLLRATATCIKAVTKFHGTNFLRMQCGMDTPLAKKLWIRWDQARQYAIQGEPEAGKPFKLRGITVFRDIDGLIRCNTRLTHSKLHSNTVAPVLLVKKSTLTRLIILDLHERNMHAGTAHTLASLRKNFWLIQGRREIFNTIHTFCYRCKRMSAKPYQNPPIAPLPEFRVTRAQQPFQAIGVDICGPFFTKPRTKMEITDTKKWIIIFTCAIVRAVHLETMEDMTTTEILSAFRRFIARRGVPHIIISDNAPQFRLIDGCIKDIWQTIAHTPAVSHYLAKQQIVWKFIPETAPWMGGLYERLIQNIKTALEKTYGNIKLDHRQFEVVTVEIEAVINSRPIAYVEREPESPILTPADFLQVKFSAIPIQAENRDQDNETVKLWKSSQEALNIYWRNWAETYLLTLRERNDQLRSQRSKTSRGPQKGDVIVMIDPAQKRSTWQTAIVERLVHSDDGIVRAAQIRLPTGVRLIRPVIKLAPIGIQTDLPGITNAQLNVQPRTLTVWPPEGASESQD